MKPVCVSRRLFAATVSLMIVVLGMSLYAFNVMRGKKNSPDLTLPRAYERAIQALGVETNSFYCLRADATAITETAGSPEWRPGFVEWHFEFHATNGQFREIIVPSRGNVTKRDKPRDGY
jgi:hypothetical protein